MSEADSVWWFLWAIGFGMGFGYRCWGEHLAARHDLPRWVTRLGQDIAAQISKIEQGHKFAGDAVKIESHAVYIRSGNEFGATIRRLARKTDA